MARTSSRRIQHAARRTRPNISYAESESDASDRADVSRSAARQPDAGTRTSTKRRRKSHTEPNEHRKLKRRKYSKHEVQISAWEQKQLSKVIPPWHKLPYEILLQIFKYASHPIINMETFHSTTATKWLLNVARLCKSFAEPALTALYSSPPLIPMFKAHMLVDLLKLDPLSTTFKYRSKIESLLVEVYQVAAYSLPGSGVLDLGGMVRHLPRLKALEFYHKKDLPPFHNLRDTIRWSFPESLFEALKYVDPNSDPARGDKIGVCKLQSWRWSSRLAGKQCPLEKLQELHSRPVFSSLKKVAFVNYQGPKAPCELSSHIGALANSVKSLRNLEHLILESCGLVTWELLSLLPTNLQNLEIINCPNFDADDLSNFLITHGSHIRSLTLDHNKRVNLAFLVVLSEACQSLQHLKVSNLNTLFHRWHRTHDGESIYNMLIDFDFIPWPRTLRSIEMTNLHHMSVTEGELIFQNLLTFAHNLPYLRVLIFQATIEASWKDRAKFREKWIKQITRVFKYVSKPASVTPCEPKENPPKPDPGQKAEVVIVNKRRSSRPSIPTKRIVIGIDPPRKPRQATRTSARHSPQEGKYAESSENSDFAQEDSYSDTNDVAPASREVKPRSTMRRELNGLVKFLPGIIPIPTDAVSSASSDSEDEVDDLDEHDSLRPSFIKGNNDKYGKPSKSGRRTQFIQGMCDVVSIRIDNQRPAEKQATEADFLDAEPSGDEDWIGDEEADDDLYAW